jgi:hypothetical protein
MTSKTKNCDGVLFGLADQIELQLAQVRGQVDKLMPSLLALAFKGEL